MLFLLLSLSLFDYEGNSPTRYFVMVVVTYKIVWFGDITRHFCLFDVFGLIFLSSHTTRIIIWGYAPKIFTLRLFKILHHGVAGPLNLFGLVFLSSRTINSSIISSGLNISVLKDFCCSTRSKLKRRGYSPSLSESWSLKFVYTTHLPTTTHTNF